MKDILTDKYNAIVDDINVVNARMKDLEKEHGQRINQLRELKGAQNIVEQLIMEVEQKEEEAKARNAELEQRFAELSEYEQEKVPSLDELVATVPKEEKQGFSVGDKVIYNGEETVVAFVSRVDGEIVVEYSKGWNSSYHPGLKEGKTYNYARPEDLTRV